MSRSLPPGPPRRPPRPRSIATPTLRLDRSDSWEIGVGPSVVVVDAGMAKALTTTTLKGDAYAFFFDQSGLMAGLGLQGTKITKVNS